MTLEFTGGGVPVPAHSLSSVSSVCAPCLSQDALGGNARAVMVTTINPSELSLQETISSCRFAQRVANVRTKPRVNEESDSQLVIAGLKQENAELQAQLATAEGEPHLSPDELRRRVCAFLEARDDGVKPCARWFFGARFSRERREGREQSRSCTK